MEIRDFWRNELIMLTKCEVVTCKREKPRRFFVCGSCWDKIPKEFRLAIREGKEKGSHTLRANPDRNWIGEVMKYVGMIKVPFVLGGGHHAVKIAADKSEV